MNVGKGMRIWVQNSVSGVPTFVPTSQTDGHSQAHPATCYDTCCSSGAVNEQTLFAETVGWMFRIWRLLVRSEVYRRPSQPHRWLARWTDHLVRGVRP